MKSHDDFYWREFRAWLMIVLGGALLIFAFYSKG